MLADADLIDKHICNCDAS